MSWFSKNKEEDTKLSELPDLPESNDLHFPSNDELPEVPEGLPEIETKPLLELPKLDTNKPEINKLPQQGFQKSQFSPLKPPVTNEPPEIRQRIPEPRTIEISPQTYSPRQLTKKAEPIFIRLDKFQNAVETFGEIREKINEIEELLKRTREIKIKEEQELEEWEREIQIIKSRIEAVDKNIFDKMD